MACSNTRPEERKVKVKQKIVQSKPIEQRVVLHAELAEKGTYMVGLPNPDYILVYHVNVELKNSSNAPLSFISMNCAHEGMFLAEDRFTMRVHPFQACEENYPILVTLAPNETYSKSIMIRPIEKKLKETIKTRVGFRFIEGDSLIKNNFETVIWSNEILVGK